MKTVVPRWIIVIVLAAGLLAACGDSDEGESARAGPDTTIGFPSTLATAPPVLPNHDATQAAPRWEQVRVVTGAANMEVPVQIASRAFQWRVKWSCDAGSLTINSTPPPPRGGALVTGTCPGTGEAFARQTGDVKLSVLGTGPWKATVEQQVDTPLDEPPLPEMANARVLSKGAFYNVERSGKGNVTLYQLADGRRALRIDPGFEVVNDPDLVIWLSPLAAPKTSREMADAPHYELSALKSTKGSQNYILPNDIPFDIRSIGLFCVPVPAIYIAASLS